MSSPREVAAVLDRFDVYVRPLRDGSFDLHASGTAVGQASGNVGAGHLTDFPRLAEMLDGPEARLTLEWCREQGGRVFAALMADKIEKLYRTALDEARSRANTLVVRINYEAQSEADLATVHEVPWELAFDRLEGQFLALWPETSICRYLRMADPEPVLKTSEAVIEATPKLLVSLAQSAGRPTLRLDEEYRRVVTASQGVEVTRLTSPGQINLVRALSAAGVSGVPYQGWHHAGHGEVDPRSMRFELVLQAQDGTEERASPAELISRFGAHRPRCAVLNVCHGGSAHGLATALAQANVPVVIGHRTKVHDRACVSFAASLWKCMAIGWPAELAIRTARMAILSRGLGSHWALPMLFVRVDDTRLNPQLPGRGKQR